MNQDYLCGHNILQHNSEDYEGQEGSINFEMRIIVILLFFLASLSAIGQDIAVESVKEKAMAAEANENGTITGAIKARGVRDARDVVVYLEGVKGEFPPPEEKPVMDQVNLVFIPHVLPVLVGTTVLFTNNDKVKHNVFSPSKCCKFNLGTYGAGIEREVTFDQPGKVALLCNVHTEMSAYVFVLESPYFALTDLEGTFSIGNIPSGTYTIKTWHEKLKEKKQEVTVLEGKTISVDFKLSR